MLYYIEEILLIGYQMRYYASLSFNQTITVDSCLTLISTAFWMRGVKVLMLCAICRVACYAAYWGCGLDWIVGYWVHDMVFSDNIDMVHIENLLSCCDSQALLCLGKKIDPSYISVLCSAENPWPYPFWKWKVDRAHIHMSSISWHYAEGGMQRAVCSPITNRTQCLFDSCRML